MRWMFHGSGRVTRPGLLRVHEAHAEAVRKHVRRHAVLDATNLNVHVGIYVGTTMSEHMSEHVPEQHLRTLCQWTCQARLSGLVLLRSIKLLSIFSVIFIVCFSAFVLRFFFLLGTFAAIRTIVLPAPNGTSAQSATCSDHGSKRLLSRCGANPG